MPDGEKGARADTEINLGGAKFGPPLELLGEGGGQNLNCKLKTFGFLVTLKVHIQSNYLAGTTLSLLQTKLAEKKLMFFTLQFQILKV